LQDRPQLGLQTVREKLLLQRSGGKLEASLRDHDHPAPGEEYLAARQGRSCGL